MAFTAPATTQPRGNQNVAATCKKGHTVFKVDGDSKNKYHCTQKVPPKDLECRAEVL